MTDISVTTTGFQSENRSWLVAQPGAVGQGYTPSGTLETALFTAGMHYPNGYVPSGAVLGRVTASRRLGPYDPAATDGRQTPVGLLYGSTQVAGKTTVGCAVVAAFAAVLPTKLPFQSGTGSLDTAARTALRNIHFAS